jgi:hypothetical protein
MSIFRLILAGFLVSAASLPVSAEGVLRKEGDWVPYIERVDPNDIRLVESKLAESYSQNSEMVMYFCDPERIFAGLSLRRHQDGYRLESMPFDAANPSRPTGTVRLPPAIAERLLYAIQFAMTLKVFPPEQVADHSRGTVAKIGSIIWINLRPTQSTVATARIGIPEIRCWVGVPDSSRPFREVVYRLFNCIDGSSYEGGAPLTELDIAISELLRVYGQ